MISPSLKGKILVFAVFIIGIATGVFSDNLYQTRVIHSANDSMGDRGGRPFNPPDRASREQDMSRMNAYLGLSQAQIDQIKKITDEGRGQFQQLHDQTDPQYKAIQEGMRAKIRAVLTEEQQKKWTEFREAHRDDPGRRPPGSDRDKSDKK